MPTSIVRLSFPNILFQDAKAVPYSSNSFSLYNCALMRALQNLQYQYDINMIFQEYVFANMLRKSTWKTVMVFPDE